MVVNSELAYFSRWIIAAAFRCLFVSHGLHDENRGVDDYSWFNVLILFVGSWYHTLYYFLRRCYFKLRSLRRQAMELVSELPIEDCSRSARGSLQVFLLFSKTWLGSWEHQVMMQALASCASPRLQAHAGSLNISNFSASLGRKELSCSNV